MSSLGSPSPFLIAGKKSYTVGRSLRFNDDDSSYLSRTPSSAGNRKTFTFSAWVKRSSFGRGVLLGASTNVGSQENGIEFDSTIIRCYEYTGSFGYRIETNAKYRDPSAWMHIVFALDTTQASSGNRAKLYVNGEQITDLNANTQPSQNHDSAYLNTTTEQRIGQLSGSHDFDGYMAEINFIDGFQYDPSYFGETDQLTGQWIPKQYTGSYGTNGFYLKFADNSGTTATTLGKDSSGNGNNFTPNNFSVTAGEGNDSLEDTPTNNYPTLNPLDFGGDSSNYQVLSNGNLQVKAQSSVWSSTRGTFHVKTGKWYWEVKIVSAASLRPFIGIIESDVRLASNQTEQSNELGATSTGIVYWGLDRIRGGANTSGYTSNVPSLSTGDIVGVALDMDNKKVFFSKNGTFFASQDPANSSGELVAFSTTMQNATIAPAIQTYDNTSEAAMNFGQRPFDYTPPTGYKKLNSQNLPSPTILKPNQYFETLLYTGNGGTQSITGLEFKPDWVWIKVRSHSGDNHHIYDSVRGAAKTIFTNTTDDEQPNDTDRLSAFNSDGFTLGDNYRVNGSGRTFVAWNWDAGETDSKTYTVTVVNDGGNKYRFDGFGTSAVTLSLAKGGTYTFNYPSAHPLRFSTTSDGTHGGGSEYTSGVSTYGNSITITVAANAPTLYYYCSQHSGMGGQVNPTTTLGSSNFDGAIQSVVKANITSGFSVLLYSGNGTDGATVGHGLGVSPDCIITKSRNLGTIGSAGAHWTVAHKGLTNGMNGGSNARKIHLSLTQAEGTNSHGCVSAVSSTTFTLKDGSSGTAPRAHVNESSGNYVAYCFNEVEGYSKFGKYIGKSYSSNDGGNFVFTGFRPAWILVKRINSTENWALWDNKRGGGINPNGYMLRPDSNTDEGGNDSGHYIDILSNGFKIRNNDSKSGTASSTYVYIAFAEAPFKYARAR